MTTKSKKKGRPSKYETLNIVKQLKTIRGWAIGGFYDKQIAAKLGITAETMLQWKKTYPEFLYALETGRDPAKANLTNSAYDQAIGYHYKELLPMKLKDITTIAGKTFSIEKVEMIEVTKYSKPDGNMTRFLMQNWMPEEYKNVSYVNAKGKLEDFFNNKKGEDTDEDNHTADNTEEGGLVE